MIEVAVDCGEGWHDGTDWAALAQGAVAAALRASPHGWIADQPFAAEVSVKLTDDAEVRQLNAQYRHKDKPTNVLSFPMVQPDLLGDIVLARGVCAAEAAEKAIATRTHATHLIVHGMLHLLGYDHLGDGEAEAMETIERAALAALGIDDPYAIDD